MLCTQAFPTTLVVFSTPKLFPVMFFEPRLFPVVFCAVRLFQSQVLCTHHVSPKSCFVQPCFSKVMFCEARLFPVMFCAVTTSQAISKLCFVHPSFSKVMFCTPRLFLVVFCAPKLRIGQFETRKLLYQGHCNTSRLQLIEENIEGGRQHGR